MAIDDGNVAFQGRTYEPDDAEYGIYVDFGDGLGKLVVVDRKARVGRNPQTGEPIQIPAKRVLKFRIAKAAKDGAM